MIYPNIRQQCLVYFFLQMKETKSYRLKEDQLFVLPFSDFFTFSPSIKTMI